MQTETKDARNARYAEQMEHLAEENGRLWQEERGKREHCEAALIAIGQIALNAQDMEFHRLRHELTRVLLIAEKAVVRVRG